jgi:hypothetical protein
MQRVPETDPEHPSRNEIFELAFDEAFGARAVFENRCPQGLVGSSPTPSASVMSRGIVDGCRGA